VAALLLIAWLARRLGQARARLDALTRGVDGTDLAAVLDRHLDTVFRVARQVDELAARTTVVEDGSRLAFQRIGLVRFNPFEDTGGNQSFAFALLDANLDGFVLSSLHARSGTRLYAKALTAGRAASQLSQEESEAVRLAMAGRSGQRREA
jgi:hypothetical protein